MTNKTGGEGRSGSDHMVRPTVRGALWARRRQWLRYDMVVAVAIGVTMGIFASGGALASWLPVLVIGAGAIGAVTVVAVAIGALMTAAVMDRTYLEYAVQVGMGAADVFVPYLLPAFTGVALVAASLSIAFGGFMDSGDALRRVSLGLCVSLLAWLASQVLVLVQVASTHASLRGYDGLLKSGLAAGKSVPEVQAQMAGHRAPAAVSDEGME